MSISAYHYVERSGALGAPLLFLFHGTGGNEHQFMDLGAALLPGAHLIGVRGDVSEGGALRYFRRTGEGVYDMPDLARRTSAMAGFVRAQKQQHEAGEVIGLGYSNGANILASVLFEAPDLFDRAVLLHPLIPFAPPSAPGLASASVLITAGRRDPICPPHLSEQLAAYFKAQGTKTELVWHEGGHEIRQTEIDAIAQALSGSKTPLSA
jgi:phospholipase/carboxylesterase